MNPNPPHNPSQPTANRAANIRQIESNYCGICEKYLQDHPEIAERNRGDALERLLKLTPHTDQKTGHRVHEYHVGKLLHSAATGAPVPARLS